MAIEISGKMFPRYTLLLNPNSNFRLRECPQCERSTFVRKFPLLIAIDDWFPIALGKTCRFCLRCEMVIVQQDELEHELAVFLKRIAPDVIGRDYFVQGVVDRDVWRQSRSPSAQRLTAMLEHVADFEQRFVLSTDEEDDDQWPEW